MSKRAMLLTGLIGLAVLTGCAVKPDSYHECGGNNCSRENHDSSSYSAMRLPVPVEIERPAA